MLFFLLIALANAIEWRHENVCRTALRNKVYTSYVTKNDEFHFDYVNDLLSANPNCEMKETKVFTDTHYGVYERTLFECRC